MALENVFGNLALDATSLAILAALASVPVTGPLTDDELRAADVVVRDAYLELEALEDQTAAGVLTFTFTAPVDLVWVLVVGGTGRATTTQTPTATLGAYCDEATPNPLTVRTSVVQVRATAGTVSVWGYR